jgi:hypothetical protein
MEPLSLALVLALNGTPDTSANEPGKMHSKQAGRYQVEPEKSPSENTLSGMFTDGKVFGSLRAAHIHNRLATGEERATALGGVLGFDTSAYHGVTLHVAGYTSQKPGAFNPSYNLRAVDFNNENGDAFTYLAEASIAYERGDYSFEIGRLLIDTPYADSDDIRMAPNTFEGAIFSMQLPREFKANAFYLKRWAGFDSGADQDRFKDLVTGGDGAAGASISFVPDPDTDISLWYYHADEMASILYGEMAGDIAFNDQLHMEYGLQGSHISQKGNSNVEGDVVGAMAIVHYGTLFGGVALNRAFIDGAKTITDGFGGGPYYTSLDEATIGAVSEGAPGEDASSVRYGIGFEFRGVGLEGLVLELVHGELKSDRTVRLHEDDVIITYEFDQWLIEATHAHYIDERNNNDKVDRTLIRVGYTF